MSYDNLYLKVYGAVTLSMLTWQQFHQNAAETKYPNLSQNKDKLRVSPLDEKNEYQ